MPGPLVRGQRGKTGQAGQTGIRAPALPCATTQGRKRHQLAPNFSNLMALKSDTSPPTRLVA